MARQLLIAGLIVTAGALVAGSVFGITGYSENAETLWTQRAGAGFAVPACGSGNVDTNNITCQSGAPAVPLSWTDGGNTDGVSCQSVYIYIPATGQVAVDNLPCTGSTTWHPATNNAEISIEARYRTATKTVCTETAPLCIPDPKTQCPGPGGECIATRTDSLTYANGEGHLIAAGTFTTPQCQPPGVDIKANNSDGPLNVDFEPIILDWTVTNNPTSCAASGAWSGSKGFSGPETVSVQPGTSNTFILSCTNFAGTVSDSVIINGNAPLAVSISFVPESPVDPNQTVTWTANASGGNGTYNYSWSGTDDLAGTTESVTKAYTSQGTKNASVTVTSGIQSSAAAASLVVNQGLGVTVTPSPTNPSVGDLVTWTANPTGGTGSYTFSWTGTDGLSGTTQSITKTYTSGGAKDASVTVTSGTQTGGASGSVSVAWLPVSADIKANGLNAASVEFGQSATLTWTSTNADTCTVTPGNWTGTSNTTGQSTGPLSSNATYTLTCANAGGSASDSVAITIGNELLATCSVSPTNAVIGQNVAWTANPTGGTGSYTFSWTGTDGLTGTATTTTKSYATAGQKTGQVTITSGTQTVTASQCSGLAEGIAVRQPTLVITPATSQLAIGGTRTLEALFDSDGPSGTALQQNVTNDAAWSSSNPDIVSVNNTTAKGTVTAVSPGTVVVTAIYSDGFGNTINATADVTVAEPTLVVTPATSQVAIGGTTQFAALFDPDGPSGASPEQDLTTTASWSSSNATVASVNNTSQKGLATGASSGSAVITALYTYSPGKTLAATAGMSVENAAPVANAKISKDNTTFTDTIVITQGLPTTVYLSAADSSDPNGWTDTAYGVSTGGKCEWNSNLDQGNPPTFEPASTVNNPASPAACNIPLGTLTFNDAPGTYTYQVLKITDNGAKVSNVDTVSITIVAAEPLSVSCVATPPANATKNQPVTWAATVSGGTGINTYSWSGTDNLAGTTPSVEKAYSATGAKTASVTVQSGVQTQTATCPTVTVFEPTLVITDPTETNFSGTTNISVKEAKQLAALYDSDGPNPPGVDSEADVTGASDWSSSDVTVATVVDGLIVGNKAGTATISTTYPDNFGNALTAQATVIVAEPTLTIIPDSVIIGRITGQNNFQLEAQYDPDGAGAIHDPQFLPLANVTWRSSNTTRVVVSGLGNLTGRNAGTAVITATYTDALGNTLTDTSNVTVTAAPPLACSPVIQEVLVGQLSGLLRAIGGDSRDYQWSTSGGIMVPASGRGSTIRVRHTEIGTYTATVNSADLSATCTVNVVNPSLSLEPVRSDITRNQAVQLSAMYDSDGSDGPNEPEDLAPFSTWSSDNTTVATVSTSAQPRGEVTGKIGGSATISATFTAFSKTLNGSATAVVHEPSFQVNPSSANLSASGANTQVQLEAQYDPDGETGAGEAEDVTIDATWSSSDAAKARVNSTTNPKGLVTALAAGAADITARFTDAFGNILSGISRITITSEPGLECTQTTDSTFINTLLRFTASGGRGSGTYRWTAPDANPNSATTDAFDTRFPEPHPGGTIVSVSSGTQTAECVIIVNAIEVPEEEEPPEQRDPNAPPPIRGFREVPPNPKFLRPEDIIPRIQTTP